MYSKHGIYNLFRHLKDLLEKPTRGKIKLFLEYDFDYFTEHYYSNTPRWENGANKFIEFMLKIINSVLEKTTQKTTQKINLNANQIKIVEYIKSNPSVTRWELANMLNISSDGVKYNLTAPSAAMRPWK